MEPHQGRSIPMWRNSMHCCTIPAGVHPPNPNVVIAGSAPAARPSVSFDTNSGIAGGSGMLSKVENSDSVLANLIAFEWYSNGLFVKIVAAAVVRLRWLKFLTSFASLMWLCDCKVKVKILILEFHGKYEKTRLTLSEMQDLAPCWTALTTPTHRSIFVSCEFKCFSQFSTIVLVDDPSWLKVWICR